MLPSEYPIRISRLKYMAQSPAHYLHALQSEFPDSAAKKFGRAVHSLVLGGPGVVAYPGRRAGKDWEAFEQTWVRERGCEVLTTHEYEGANRIAQKVHEIPDAAHLLTARHKELRIDWNIGKRACQSTLDIVDDGFVADLKTCRTARPDWFQRTALNMGYHAQLAFYQAAAAFQGIKANDAYIIAVETKPPFEVVVHLLSPRVLDLGRRTYSLWLERLLVCEESHEWPGYAQSVVDFDIQEDPELNLEGIEEEASE